MKLYVLLDREARVYGVVREIGMAEEFLTFDDSFGYVECKLDDYTSFNKIREMLEPSTAPVMPWTLRVRGKG